MALKMQKLSLAVWLLATVVVGVAVALYEPESWPPRAQQPQFYDFRCFDGAANDTATLELRQISIGLEVTNRVTHQLMSRIFAIFLREVLHYRNISLVSIDFMGNLSDPKFEEYKIMNTLKLIDHHYLLPNMNMINLEVWMSTMAHDLIPATVFEAGPSITPGRFGWFVPESQFQNSDRTIESDSLRHEIFSNPTNPYYERYLISNELQHTLRTSPGSEQFISPRCEQRACVTLLAEHRPDSHFVEDQIREADSYLNVLWLGQHFQERIMWLHQLYLGNSTYRNSRFVVLHWTPSDIINAEIQFKQFSVPKCEDSPALLKSLCKYEFTPLLKYFPNTLASDDRLLKVLRKFCIVDEDLRELQHDLAVQRRSGSYLTPEQIYDRVACNWLKNHQAIYTKWIPKDPMITLQIGGIFPMNQSSRGHENLVEAVRYAVKAINQNTTVLANYELAVLENDGQCKEHVVMQTFIHYFNIKPNVLGVLGPACSETVEPIAGISKHMNMPVISYSAEGASFTDRVTYPYFFRTIGSNRQYEDVYIKLMQKLDWRRVAALTEDGQKYTEYISHMEGSMKEHDLELIVNKKFLNDVTAADMNKFLLDLKQRHAKIIIADIHQRNAELALCAAFKLDMTAYNGYVWFLPFWLSKDWRKKAPSSNVSCSVNELEEAFQGHFSIMHAPFGEPNATMQENVPIKQWIRNYTAEIGSENISNYTGFAYDAVWTYALAADKLLRENKDAVKNMRSKVVAKRLVDLIGQTDFEGLSGRVRFGQGGSRITELNLLQWRKPRFIQVGKYTPQVIGHGGNLRPNEGQLTLYANTIEWLTSDGQPPGDGTYDCSFSALAELLSTDCDTAASVVTVLFCLMAVVVVSLVSFLFWKRRYDSKLRRSAKIMKNFGIDLLSPSRSVCNTLDKWEIPKENVVVNRRLGEGAFGTVYGGEAQLDSEGWTAVAVKTLKAGASTEDRLDFLSEAEAMKRLDHKNIVKLLGVCLQSEPIYTIMEFMLYGDLKTYLLARRHMVNDKLSDDSDISSKRLTMYAMDVARGLEYLAEKKYVHRDIACRNCLVNAQRVVKLGDFGMARPTHDSDYYRFNRKGMLPVRWMAPESLVYGLFTPSSDVWAFGVVLYEVITFGSFPYQGLTNNQVLEFVRKGNNLQVPIGVKPQLEGLLKACWNEDPEKRPTANDIVEYISGYPRLLTPCLDFPGASVEMPETESDELELLPKPRKCSPIKKGSTLDILPENATLNSFDPHHKFLEGVELPEHTNIDMGSAQVKTTPPTTTTNSFSPITPDGYSIMSPLLMKHVSESSDSSQTQLLSESPPEA